MSDREDQEIISSLRRTYQAFSRADFDGAAELMHPEIEYVPVGDQTPLRGADALRAWMEPDAFDEQQAEPLDFRINANKVLVRQHFRARGAGSGVELDVESWAVWTLDEDGQVIRLEMYLSHQESEALKAAGLSE